MHAQVLDVLLDRVERSEYASLVWGFVDGGLSEDEVLAAADQALRDAGIDGNSETLVATAIEARLLFPFTPLGRPTLYRSRFGEGVRLFSRLRQMFHNRDWRTAARLVSDYRVSRTPRRFPRRDVLASTVLQSLQDGVGLSTLQEELWEALTDDLSGLAGFQQRAIIEALGSQGDRGFIVTAGTGSGKTYCFYLPVLLDLGTRIEVGPAYTKALAIYPRIELLKDQFSEAFRTLRVVKPVLEAHGRRPLTLGTYFGATPREATPDAVKAAGWSRRGSGYTCPFLRPVLRVGSREQRVDLIWHDDDLARGVERLRSVGVDPPISIGPNELVLTRNRAIIEPPDLLFTTLESLNTRMADLGVRRIFGLSAPREQRPRWVLLDEVHTYTGLTGAQSALVVRRWRENVRAPVTLVGLSATLTQAESFFAQLTGLPPWRVKEITPGVAELEEESAEYQLLLRGDPVSQTALLSASIQSAMLLTRLLDPRGQSQSLGRFGQRVFAFTDNLDVVNRFFDDLADAEGWNTRMQPSDDPLAYLRASDHPIGQRGDREADGQVWRASEEIGWDLQMRLRVGRTSSQDPDVDADSDVVVATSSLEVGFNDDRVGGVLQHKAPRDMAAFVQRKGRAGRTRAMRPWTVVVLSDYGLDRLAYQAYEQLLQPTLPPQSLPVRNEYVLRIQAVYALLDWLAQRLDSTHSQGWLWYHLSAPAAVLYSNPGSVAFCRQRQQEVLSELRSLSEPGSKELNLLATHLERALLIPEDQVVRLLWSQPRSLLLEVVPTLIRRLETQWKQVLSQRVGELDYYRKYLPVPEFIPGNLFSELNLPEVEIVFPPADHLDPQSENVFFAMNHLAPGQVTRRYGFRHGHASHWIPVDADQPEVTLSLRNYIARGQYLGEFTRENSPTGDTIPVYRPWQMHLARALPHQATEASKSQLHWESEFIPQGNPLVLPLGGAWAWKSVLRSVAFYLHSRQVSVLVRRFAAGATAQISRFRDRTIERRTVTVSFSSRDALVAAGFEQAVDGLLVNYVLPSAAQLANRSMSNELRATSRAAFYRHQVLTDRGLPSDCNIFQRDWLQQIYLSALMAQAVRYGMDLNAACESLHQHEPQDSFREVMDSIFSIQEAVLEMRTEEGAPEAGDGTAHTSPEQRLRTQLESLLDNPAVLSRLRHAATALWLVRPEGWGRWLQERLHFTMAEAVLMACLESAPETAMLETLAVDALPLPNTDEEINAGVWITEDTMGGAGVMQALAAVYSEEPRRFFRALEGAIALSDLELASIALEGLLELIVQGGEPAHVIESVRSASTQSERLQSLQDLRQLLIEYNLYPGRTMLTSLSARLLRPGLGVESDALFRDLLARWRDWEGQWGAAIDLRVFSYLAICDPEFADRVDQLFGLHGTTELSARVGVLSGILWPRSSEVRQRVLQSYNRFRGRPRPTDPALVREVLLTDQVPTVRVSNGDWKRQVHEVLREAGICALAASIGEERRLRQALVRLLAEPVEDEYLQLYPYVDRYEIGVTERRAVLALMEKV